MDYERIPLACFVARADVIAVAQLPDHSSGYVYEARLTQVLQGDVSLGPLQVNESSRWITSPPQFKTHEALLFLKRKSDGMWQVWGPSNEGRISLDFDLADVSAISLPVPIPAEGYPRELFLDALQSAAHCFSFEIADRLILPKSRCETSQMAQIMTRSELHQKLLQRFLDARQQGLRCPM